MLEIIDKQATIEQPCSPLAAVGDLDRVNSEDSSDQDCEQHKHDFMDSWLGLGFVTILKYTKVMYYDWCLQSGKKNTFTTGCRNFRTSTLTFEEKECRNFAK